jgi:hypothetical protein
MPAKGVWLPLAVVTLLGLGLRLWDLGGPSLWYDEAATVYLSHFMAMPAKLFDITQNMEAPLAAVMVWGWSALTGIFYGPAVTSEASDFLLRLLPCLFSAAGVPMIYVLTRKLVDDRRAALAAAVLFAVSPFQIYYAQELRSYAFTAAGGLAAVYLCVRALDGRRNDYPLLALLMGALFYNHFTMVWFFLALNLYALVVVVRERGRLIPWTICQLLLIGIIARGVALAHEANQLWLKVTDQWETFPRPTVKTGVITFKDFFAGYSGTAWAYYPLLLLGGGLMVLGFWHLRRRPMQALLLALVIFLPLGVNLVFWQLRTLSLYEHRIFILQGAVVLVPVAAGLAALPGRHTWAVVLGLFALLTVPALRDHYAHRLHPVQEHRIGVFDKVGFREAARHIKERWEAGDVVAHDSNFTIYSMKHYLPVTQHHLDMSGGDAALYVRYMGAEALLRNHGLLPVPAAEATRDARRVWLVEAEGITFDAQPQSEPARDWLARHLVSGEVWEGDGVRVRLFVRGETSPLIPLRRGT